MGEPSYAIIEGWGNHHSGAAFFASPYHLLRLVYSFKLALTSQVVSAADDDPEDELDPVHLTEVARRLLSHRILAVPRKFWSDEYVQEQWERLDEDITMDTTGGSFDMGDNHYAHVTFHEVGRHQIEPPESGGEPNCNVAPEVEGEDRFECVSDMARRAAGLDAASPKKRKRGSSGGASPSGPPKKSRGSPGSGGGIKTDDDDSGDDSDESAEDPHNDRALEVLLIRPVVCIHANEGGDRSGSDDDDE